GRPCEAGAGRNAFAPLPRRTEGHIEAFVPLVELREAGRAALARERRIAGRAERAGPVAELALPAHCRFEPLIAAIEIVFLLIALPAHGGHEQQVESLRRALDA